MWGGVGGIKIVVNIISSINFKENKEFPNSKRCKGIILLNTLTEKYILHELITSIFCIIESLIGKLKHIFITDLKRHTFHNALLRGNTHFLLKHNLDL